MRWEDERYVRIYTRDTPDWSALGWEAQSLFCLTMRKVDRAGILELGKSGLRGLAAVVAMPLELVERAMPVLLEDGCVVLRGSTLVIPNFIEAQESKQSDPQRKRESRARARDLASAGVTKRDDESQNVTTTDASQGVTSASVTPSCAVPNRAVPSQQQPRAGAREAPPPPVSAGGTAERGTPPAPPAVPSPEADEPPRRPLVVVDDSPAAPQAEPVQRPWPRVRQFQERLQAELRRVRPLPVGSGANTHDELEAALDRCGVQGAVIACREVYLRQKANGAELPATLAYFLPVLRGLPVALTEGPTLGEKLTAVRGPEWRRVLAAMQERTSQQHAPALERWLLPLSGQLVAGVLVLEAPDQFHRDFVAENYRRDLEAAAAEVLGRKTRVDVVHVLPDAAGGEA